VRGFDELVRGGGFAHVGFFGRERVVADLVEQDRVAMQHAARDTEQPTIVTAHQRLESHPIALPRELDQPVVRQVGKGTPACGVIVGFGIGNRAHATTMRQIANLFPSE
jgi:hypothetical protein